MKNKNIHLAILFFLLSFATTAGEPCPPETSDSECSPQIHLGENDFPERNVLALENEGAWWPTIKTFMFGSATTITIIAMLFWCSWCAAFML